MIIIYYYTFTVFVFHTLARIFIEYVAYDGDGDENCYPISYSHFSPTQGVYLEK